MVKIREEKITRIADHIPPQRLDSGPDKGDVLVLGWGSTYGAIKSAVAELQKEGYAVSHAHLRYLRPFPANLGEILRNFKQVLIPEINNGQLIRIIRDQFLIGAIGYNKIMGVPITRTELSVKIREMLGSNN
jgi:2-oxoglutarate ferredoxin oxidoreductase subunit alpha